MTSLADYSKEERDAFNNLCERICELKPSCHRIKDTCADRDCKRIIEDLMMHIMRKDEPISLQMRKRRLDYGC
jgi:hypothetical protein